MNIRRKVKLLPIGFLCLFISACNITVTSDDGTTEILIEQNQKNQLPSNNFTRHFVEDAKKRKAVCNDGSPAAFYFEKGHLNKDEDLLEQNKWVIFLKGGGSCSSDADCLSRMDEDNLDIKLGKWKHRMTSKHYIPETSFGGILNNDPELNKDFHNFNKVFIMYCSSDSWVGDKEKSDGLFHFRGKRIVTEVMRDLKKYFRLDQASHLIFAGSSAGSVGMGYNLDMITEMLPQAKVLGIRDASFSPNLNADMGGNLDEELQEIINARVEYWNPVYDRTCFEQNIDDPTVCLNFGYLYRNNYLETPFFVYMDQNDHMVMDRFSNSDNQIVKDAVAESIRKDLYYFPYGVFSTRTGNHVALTDDNKFFHLNVKGLTYYKTLANWVYQRSGEVKVIAD